MCKVCGLQTTLDGFSKNESINARSAHQADCSDSSIGASRIPTGTDPAGLQPGRLGGLEPTPRLSPQNILRRHWQVAIVAWQHDNEGHRCGLITPPSEHLGLDLSQPNLVLGTLQSQRIGY